MPSFDIVSKTNLPEVDNALAGLAREIGQRFDFKGSSSKVERKELVLTLHADDDLKLKQVQELLRQHLARRKVDVSCLDEKPVEKATGASVRQTILIKQGIASDLAKKIVTAIKGSKMKVQTAIQGDELRITGKNRDDLQSAIALVRGLDVGQPLQYVNFRD